MKTKDKEAFIESFKIAFESNPPTWANVFKIADKIYESHISEQTAKWRELYKKTKELDHFKCRTDQNIEMARESTRMIIILRRRIREIEKELGLKE